MFGDLQRQSGHLVEGDETGKTPLSPARGIVWAQPAAGRNLRGHANIERFVRRSPDTQGRYAARNQSDSAAVKPQENGHYDSSADWRGGWKRGSRGRSHLSGLATALTSVAPG